MKIVPTNILLCLKNEGKLSPPGCSPCRKAQRWSHGTSATKPPTWAWEALGISWGVLSGSTRSFGEGKGEKFS